MRVSINSIHSSFLFILMTFLLWNNFFIPLDKVLLPLFIVALIFTGKYLVQRNVIAFFVLSSLYIAIISIFNIDTASLLIYYPILFVVAAFLAADSKYFTTEMVMKALYINIIAGLVFIILHYAGVENPYVYSLAEKGLPNVYFARGFSPTVQVYGTCCILWLILYFERNIKNKRIPFLIVVGALCGSFNRVSLLFLMVILFYYRKTLFYSIVALFVTLSIIYFDVLQEIFFGVSTLESRVQLRDGFRMSYWESNDNFVYLLGRANNLTTDAIASRTYWGRNYIENGVDFILHCYGIIGLIVYGLLLIVLFYRLLNLRQYKLAAFAGYYYIMLQWFTNEFLASTFFFFTAVILMLSKQYQRERGQSNLHRYKK